ncbi:MAG: hypothetical protein H9Q65_04875 [Spiroplasma ixodetis]|nr:hypothetical protein [Spiroplasma ixodetis]MBP1527168.1 hypothetical protein [Spiroplasma ixodetis]MBP1528557.1 hypothetical protein [Spiroplasma ixodetis]
MNGEQFEKFEKVAQMLRRNRGADIRVRQEKQKLGNLLGLKEIKKVNSETSTSKSQSSSSKSQKM